MLVRKVLNTNNSLPPHRVADNDVEATHYPHNVGDQPLANSLISRIVPQGDGIAACLIKATTPAASGFLARQIIDGNVRPLPSKGDGGATAVSGA